MNFHLLLFCLYVHSTICAHLQQQYPHAAYKRQLNHAVQLGTLPEPKDEHNSNGRWSQQAFSSNANFTEDRRVSLEARAGPNRAGPSTAGTAVLDKTFDKKVKKFMTKWEKSANGKTLHTLFNKILASPSVQVADCLWSMPYSLEHDQSVQQLAVFESLLKISTVVLLTDNKRICSLP